MNGGEAHPLVVRTIDKLSEWGGRVALALVVPLVLISAGNAIVRYALNYSSNGWLEIQWYLFAAIFLLGASYVLKQNAHVRIDLAFHKLNPRTQSALDLATMGLFLIPFAALMLWMGWAFFYTSYASGEVSSNVGGLLRWPVKALVPVGMILLLLQGVAEMVKRYRTLVERTGLDSDSGQGRGMESDNA